MGRLIDGARWLLGFALLAATFALTGALLCAAVIGSWRFALGLIGAVLK